MLSIGYDKSKLYGSPGHAKSPVHSDGRIQITKNNPLDRRQDHWLYSNPLYRVLALLYLEPPLPGHGTYLSPFYLGQLNPCMDPKLYRYLCLRTPQSSHLS
ncbi:hypothetical protein LIER_41713 [Lithospermum erythrorhizon]|uniref:Uncharacterized protein n=1 Tax=Lithospermum erythrorhizon TaxID=34254 RepID=A0AAV3RD83_LITER